MQRKQTEIIYCLLVNEEGYLIEADTRDFFDPEDPCHENCEEYETYQNKDSIEHPCTNCSDKCPDCHDDCSDIDDYNETQNMENPCDSCDSFTSGEIVEQIEVFKEFADMILNRDTWDFSDGYEAWQACLDAKQVVIDYYKQAEKEGFDPLTITIDGKTYQQTSGMCSCCGHGASMENSGNNHNEDNYLDNFWLFKAGYCDSDGIYMARLCANLAIQEGCLYDIDPKEASKDIQDMANLANSLLADDNDCIDMQDIKEGY